MTLPSPDPSSPLQPPSIHGTFFSISVPDADAATRWYQQALGMRVVMAGTMPEPIVKFALMEGNGLIVEIIQASSARERTGRPFETHGFFKTGVLVDDLDGLLAALKARGTAIAYDLMPLQELGLRCFLLQDCAGNFLQFMGK